MGYDHRGASFLADVLVVALLKRPGVRKRRVTVRRPCQHVVDRVCLGATW
jgi:hypothetical protein